jgi:hypothetical protein
MDDSGAWRKLGDCLDPDIIGIGHRGHHIRRSQILAASASKRPHRGRLQHRIRRLVTIADEPPSTVELARAHYGEPTEHWHRVSIRRSAPAFCEPIGCTLRHRSTIWGLKTTPYD